jgi:hypothetical protein
MLFQKFLLTVPEDITTPSLFVRWLFNRKEKKREQLMLYD